MAGAGPTARGSRSSSARTRRTRGTRPSARGASRAARAPGAGCAARPRAGSRAIAKMIAAITGGEPRFHHSGPYTQPSSAKRRHQPLSKRTRGTEMRELHRDGAPDAGRYRTHVRTCQRRADGNSGHSGRPLSSADEDARGRCISPGDGPGRYAPHDADPPGHMVSPARVVFLAWSTGLGDARRAGRRARRARVSPRLGVLSAAWYAVATIGVFFPRLEMYGPHRLAAAPPGGARVALTFDDGPHPVTTRRILDDARADPPPRDVLRAGREGAPPSGRRSRDSCRRPYARGARRSSRPVALLPHAVARARRDPPGGAGGRGRDGRTAPLLPSAARPHERHHRTRGARRAGVTLVGWSVARLRRHARTNARRPSSSASRAALTDGAIVMLHDAAEHDDFEPASVRALPRLLGLLDGRGLTSVGLDALLGDGAVPGAAHRGGGDRPHSARSPLGPTIAGSAAASTSDRTRSGVPRRASDGFRPERRSGPVSF